MAFYSEFGVYPHILLCNDFTFGMIDLIAHASPDNLFNELGQRPGPDQLTELGSFDTDVCTLDFCRDNNLQNGCYSLVLDTHAELVESNIP